MMHWVGPSPSGMFPGITDLQVYSNNCFPTKALNPAVGCESPSAGHKELLTQNSSLRAFTLNHQHHSLKEATAGSLLLPGLMQQAWCSSGSAASTASPSQHQPIVVLPGSESSSTSKFTEGASEEDSDMLPYPC